MRIYFHPPELEAKMTDWLGKEVLLRPQIGSELGARMDHAFKETFSDGFARVLLIGSDLPDLPGSFLTAAFTALSRWDVVLGPAIDGGYYLVGFRSDTYIQDIFFNMPWGSPLVFERTLEVLKRLGLRVYLLPLWTDIDTVEDLAEFVERYSIASRKAKNTLHYIKTKRLKRSNPLH